MDTDAATAGEPDYDEMSDDYDDDDDDSYDDDFYSHLEFADDAAYARQLQQGIEDNEASLVAARADRHELTMNQQIRRDQDLAYEESLKADQEKEKKRRAEQEKRDAEQKLVKEKEQAEQDLRTRLLKLKVELADRIPAEPAATDENVIRLLVKLPNGTRLERRFKRNTSLKVLAFFIFCQEQR